MSDRTEINTALAKSASELTDVELAQELTECRMVLESIIPYRHREISRRQWLLWREYDLRRTIRAGHDAQREGGGK